MAEGKDKIAMFDLFRLLILKDSQAQYILTNHYDLVSVSIIGYLSSYNLEDAEARLV